MHPGVKYARRKEVADLVSSQVLQKTLDELRNITRIDLCVTNTDGVLLVTTFPETAIDAESIRSFVLSAADSQIVQEYHYFKVYDNQNVEYILISKGSSDDAYMIGKVAVCEIQNLIIAYKERLDKNNFIQNLLLDNLLLVDVYNRAKKLRIDTDVRRVVYMVETKLEKDISAQETVKSLFASRPRDFITAVDEKSIIIVKELKDTDTFEDMNQTARMLVDMLNAEAMSQVRVSYGNPVSEIKEIKVSGYKTHMGKITVKVPMAALPESGTTVAVIIRVKTPNGKIVNLPLAGVVVEETVVVNGVARKVRKVQLELDATTMINLQAGKAYIAAVTRK